MKIVMPTFFEIEIYRWDSMFYGCINLIKSIAMSNEHILNIYEFQ